MDLRSRQTRFEAGELLGDWSGLAGEIIWRGGKDAERNESRAAALQEIRGVFLPSGQIGKGGNACQTGGFCESPAKSIAASLAGVFWPPVTSYRRFSRTTIVRFVALAGRDGYERTEAHQQRPVARDDQNVPLRLCQGEAEAEWNCAAHRRGIVVEVERMIGQFGPDAGGSLIGDDDLIVGAQINQNLQAATTGMPSVSCSRVFIRLGPLPAAPARACGPADRRENVLSAFVFPQACESRRS